MEVLLTDTKVMWVLSRSILGCLLKRYYTGIAAESRGAIYWNSLGLE